MTFIGFMGDMTVPKMNKAGFVNALFKPNERINLMSFCCETFGC